MEMDGHEPGLSDYALIGNCCAAALVSRFGSIDWCCLPEFHSPAIFSALLDRRKGGYFSIAPVDEYESSHGYLAHTNVVATDFKTTTGSVRLLDAFTAVEEQEKRGSLYPDHEILRIIEGVEGNVRLKFEFAPRIFYGKTSPKLQDHRKLGIKISWREHTVNFLSTLNPREVHVDTRSGRVTGEFEIEKDRQIVFSLSYSSQAPSVIPEIRTTATRRMEETIRYWKNWIGTCKYSGPYKEHVQRSALTLKLLAHAPSGAIIAAPTTSLPESIGGQRNWDYRFCWLRDASFTIRVLIKLGFVDEAHAYMNWILHATRLTQPQLQVVYSVYGHSRLKEKTLDWLAGYHNSRPVRIGNKADVQFQLDVYGEVLDAIFSYSQVVDTFDRISRRFTIGLGKEICRIWKEPDNGIWEIRSPGVHHTHSKVMAWVGLDRLIKLCEKYNWDRVPTDDFRATRQAIQHDIESRGYSEELNSYTREFNGTNLDASLLTLSLVEYCNYAAPRMVSTVNRIRQQLSDHGFVYRYRDVDDGLSGNEGAFLLCNFWLVENLVQSGDLDEGIRVFEETLKHASPTGLFSEEIDPTSGDLLGNYPQGFTHIGLINAALAIDQVLKERAVTI